MIEVRQVHEFVDPITMESVVGANIIISKSDIREDIADSLATTIGRIVLKEMFVNADLERH